MARTQAELAELVGYSRVTVSKALSGHPSVQPSTRRHILEKAREVGYRPNAAARQMRSGRFHAAAMLTSMATHPYLPCMLYRGLQHGLAARDLLMTVTEIDEAMLGPEGDSPRILRELNADGLLIDFNAGNSKAVRDLVAKLAMPAIWLNRKYHRNAVYVDDIDGGRKATEYLLKAGHRKIGYLSASGSERHYSVPDRYAGYADAMAAAGLQPVDLLPTKTRIPNSERFQHVRRILAGGDRPTAIYAYEQQEFSTIVIVASELGLKLPRDLSVVITTHALHGLFEFPPAITQIPFHAVGQQAVDALVQRIDNPDTDFQSVAVPYGEVTEGQTVGPPA